MQKIKSLLFVIFTITFFDSYPAWAGKLTQWSFDPNQNQLEFTLEESTTPKYFVLENPVRIVIDLPNTDLGNVKTKENYSSMVREVRLSQFEEGVTRLVLELSAEVELTSEQISLEKIASNAEGTRWRLRKNANKSGDVTVTVPPLQPQPENSNVTDENSQLGSKSPIIQFGQPLPKPENPVIPSSQNNQSLILEKSEKMAFSSINPLKNNILLKTSSNQTVIDETGLIVPVELTNDWGY